MKVESLEGFEWEGKLFHTSCFVCSICNKEIDMSVGFQKMDEKQICASCFKSKSSSKCAGCGKPLSGAVLAIKNSKYHPACFTCAQCNKPIGSDGFTQRAAGYICSACTKSSTSTTTKTVVTSGMRTGGFVVDPKTGKKIPTTPQ